MSAITELRRTSGTLRCLECGKCSTLCPLSEFGDFSAARMAAIHDPGKQRASFSKTIDRCLTCGSCELRCPQGVRFTEFVRGLRGEITDHDRTPCPHGSALQAAARLMAASNGAKRDRSWLRDGLRIADRGEIALFVGCLPLFDQMFGCELGVESTEIARSAIRLLNAAGIEPVIVDQERCCGHDLLWNGDGATFQKLAEANVTAFKDRGVKHIITTCAECCRTWKVDYASARPEYKPVIEHISEFLARSVESGDLSFGKDEATKVTYQDPCRLARQLGILDAPRRALDAIENTELVEMSLHGEDARCCGTAGFIHCDGDSRRMQSARLESARDTGAEVLITACPKCWIHFACAQCEDGLRRRETRNIRVEDLTLYAARRLRAAESGSSKTHGERG